MMYILSEDEYKELKANADRGARLAGHTAVGMTTKQLQKLCTLIADTMPVKWGWARRGEPDPPKPWGCIITAEKQDPPQEWYCDTCPVHNLCPHPHKAHSQ